jgi:alpha-L-fucosidase
MVQWQSEAVLVENSYHADVPQIEDGYMQHGWPSDVFTYEMFLPKGAVNKWRTVQGKKYYMPVEVCYPIGHSWFYTTDAVQSDKELLGMYLITRSRGASLLLDVPPDKTGKIPAVYVDALMRLQHNVSIVT